MLLDGLQTEEAKAIAAQLKHERPQQVVHCHVYHTYTITRTSLTLPVLIDRTWLSVLQRVVRTAEPPDRTRKLPAGVYTTPAASTQGLSSIIIALLHIGQPMSAPNMHSRMLSDNLCISACHCPANCCCLCGGTAVMLEWPQLILITGWQLPHPAMLPCHPYCMNNISTRLPLNP